MKKILMASLIAGALALPAMALAQKTEVRVGFTTDAFNLDPGNYRNRETETILGNMYNGLFTHDSAMKAVPDLVESAQQKDDRTYIFKLHKGVKFHSGDELTADDVVFTFERIITPKAIGGVSSPRASLLGPLKEVKALDRYTVEFIMDKPWPILQAMLPFQQVVSKKFVEKIGDRAYATREDGTGPFKLVEWRKGDSMAMEKFADYWKGAPKIDRVVYKVMPENSSRVAALLAGDIQIAKDIPIDSLEQVKNSGTATVMQVNGTRSFFISMNNKKPPFDNVLVRQAANYAINKKLIIDKVLKGTAVPLNGVLSPDAFGFDKNLPAYDFDLKKAKALLAQAGHPKGIDVTLETDGSQSEMAQILSSLLAKAGIRAKVVIGELSTLKQKWASADNKGDMFLTSWGNASLDPDDIMMPTIRSGGRGNSANYSNPEVDRLLDAASVETNARKRAELFRQVQEIVHKDAPWVFLWLPQDIYGVSKRLAGFTPRADSQIDLSKAYLK